MKFDYDFRKYDFKLIFYMLILNFTGIVIVKSANSAESFKDPVVIRQLIGSMAGVILCIVFSFIDYKSVIKRYKIIYLISLFMLAFVLFSGTSSSHGAVRWIELPLIGKIQPAEFVKVALILFFGTYLEKIGDDINSFKKFSLVAILYLIPVMLVLMQPNLSTAIIMTVIMGAILFASKLNFKIILVTLGIITVGVFLILYLFKSGLYENIPFIHEYQARRILTFLDPSKDIDSYRQQMNSIMAIASGQLRGKGLYNNSIFSLKNGNFLIEEDNDFIFAVIGEELGFRGSVIIIIVFLLILVECLIIAYKSENESGKLIAVGMAAFIAFQTYTNIAVATGLFPNTGITLPFFSRGVSSLISLYLGMGIVLNIALQQKNNGGKI